MGEEIPYYMRRIIESKDGGGADDDSLRTSDSSRESKGHLVDPKYRSKDS